MELCCCFGTPSQPCSVSRTVLDYHFMQIKAYSLKNSSQVVRLCDSQLLYDCRDVFCTTYLENARLRLSSHIDLRGPQYTLMLRHDRLSDAHVFAMKPKSKLRSVLMLMRKHNAKVPVDDGKEKEVDRSTMQQTSE